MSLERAYLPLARQPLLAPLLLHRFEHVLVRAQHRNSVDQRQQGRARQHTLVTGHSDSPERTILPRSAAEDTQRSQARPLTHHVTRFSESVIPQKNAPQESAKTNDEIASNAIRHLYRRTRVILGGLYRWRWAM